MTALRVILASRSPRRRDLLTLVGIAHEVVPADIDESLLPNEDPIPHAERLAREKAMTVARQRTDALVIAADTIVVLDGGLLGKPVDRAEARETLRKLSGRTHTVHTAVAVAHAKRLRSGVESVAVTFRHLTDEQIVRYVETEEPMDKAGAYGIQGYGATLVERIDGDYFSVMGLAIGRLVSLLGEVGVTYNFDQGLGEPSDAVSSPSPRLPE